MYQEYFNFIQEGWRCPQCKSILAPHISFCPYCNAERKTFASTSTNPTVIPFDDKGWWDDYQRRTTGDVEALNQLWKQFTISSGTNVEITPSGAYLCHGPALECYL